MRYALLSLILAGAASLVGCCDTAVPQSLVEYPPFYAPSTVVAQRDAEPGYLLPSSDGEAYIPRSEKMVYGGLSLGTTTAYSVYTYDAQRISIRHSGGTGYRYRTLVEGGVILLPTP